jgi:hypothetical protein
MSHSHNDIMNAKGTSIGEYGFDEALTIKEYIEKLTELKERFGEDAYIIADAGYNNIDHEVKTQFEIQSQKEKVKNIEKEKARKKEEQEIKKLKTLQKKYKNK